MVKCNSLATEYINSTSSLLQLRERCDWSKDHLLTLQIKLSHVKENTKMQLNLPRVHESFQRMVCSSTYICVMQLVTL